MVTIGRERSCAHGTTPAISEAMRTSNIPAFQVGAPGQDECNDSFENLLQKVEDQSNCPWLAAGVTSQFYRPVLGRTAATQPALGLSRIMMIP